jgi:hypothetical protein
MSDKANIHLHGTVNKQNFWYLSAENPHRLHHHPLYGPEVTVLCALWSIGVIGHYFFEDEAIQSITVTSQQYREMLNEFLAPQLPPNHNFWFQQYGAVSTWQWLAWLCFVICLLWGDFSFWWCAMSSLFTRPNSNWLVLGGYLKSKVYGRWPIGLNALK